MTHIFMTLENLINLNINKLLSTIVCCLILMKAVGKAFCLPVDYR